MKSNGIDVSYLKNTDTSLSYVGDGMAYLHNWYKNSYFITYDWQGDNVYPNIYVYRKGTE